VPKARIKGQNVLLLLTGTVRVFKQHKPATENMLACMHIGVCVDDS
jgi:hypothetical protein